MWKYLKEQSQALTKKEKEFVIITAIIILLFTLIPLAVALSINGSNYFTGGTFIAAADKMVYFSQIEEARQGNFLFHNLYTAEPQVGYFSPLWLILGWFSKITILAPLFTFHLFRLILGFIFLYLLYLFIAQLFLEVNWRRIAFLVLSLSSGLGIFTVLRPWTSENMYNYFGVDIWFSEGNTFLTLYHSPLFILSQICLLTIFWWLIQRLFSAGYGEAIIIGLIGMFLGFIHPYDIVIVLTVGSSWFLLLVVKYKKWPWSAFFKLGLIFFISLVPIAYFIVLRYLSPGFAGWAVQNITLSPRPYNYMIGYGLIFLGFLIGIYSAWKSKSRYFNFLALWSIVSWLLLYLPLQSQRRLGNGIHIPLVLLAILGFVILLNYLKKFKFFKLLQRHYLVTLLIVFVLSFFLVSSNLFIYGAEFFYLFRGGFHISQQEKQAMDWLKNHVKRTEIILSQNKSGSIVPALTARYVYLGHGHQTNNWEIKKFEAEKWFFKINSHDQLKQKWLNQEKIDYVYFGPREQALGSYQPATKDYLELVYQNPEVAIYQVKH